jgi:hypothetical protein
MIKTIYFFWYQGISGSPLLIQKCLESWIFYNPTWKICVLDQTNYQSYTEFHYDGTMTLIKFSDFLRLSILKTYGGLWVDATCFCNISLDEWLPERCFLFENKTLHYKISTWFIYSEPNHPLITSWYDAVNKIEPEKIQSTYFVFYDAFDELCKEEAFTKEWENIPKIDQNDSLMYLDIKKKGNTHEHSDGFLEPLTIEIKEMILQKKKYLFKLSYKFDQERVIDASSILSFLFSTLDPLREKSI